MRRLTPHTALHIADQLRGGLQNMLLSLIGSASAILRRHRRARWGLSHSGRAHGVGIWQKHRARGLGMRGGRSAVRGGASPQAQRSGHLFRSRATVGSEGRS